MERPRDFLPFKISKETVWKVELSLSDYQAQKKRRCNPRWFDARWRRRRVFQGREAPRYLQLMQLWIDVTSYQRLQREPLALRAPIHETTSNGLACRKLCQQPPRPWRHTPNSG